MKKNLLILTAVTLVSVGLSMGCGSTSQKIQGALPTKQPPMYQLSHENPYIGQKATTRTESVGTADATIPSSDENQVLALTNNERQKAGLPPLQMNSQLVNMARAKAWDMVNQNYFDHNSPTYGSPFDMMMSWGVRFTTAGENIAGNPAVQDAMTMWMNSPGHRANILNNQYSEIGVGVVDGGPYGKMLVQEFIHP